MKLFLKSNTLVVVLALCLLSFLSYRAIETDTCFQGDSDPVSFKIGSCVN